MTPEQFDALMSRLGQIKLALTLLLMVVSFAVAWFVQHSFTQK